MTNYIKSANSTNYINCINSTNCKLTVVISEEDSKYPDEYFDILCERESVGCYIHNTDTFTLRVNQLHNYIKYNRAVSLLFYWYYQQATQFDLVKHSNTNTILGSV